MKVHRHCIRCLVVLLPFMLTACAHRYSNVARTSHKPAADSALEQPVAPQNTAADMSADRESKADDKTVKLTGHEAEDAPPELSIVFAEPNSGEEPKLTPVPENAGSSVAAPAPADGKGNVPNTVLSLADLKTIALESNPTLSQLASVIDKAHGIHEQVGIPPNPVVGYSANEIGADGGAGQQGAFISQTIVTGGKLSKNRDVASWNIQEMSWEYQAQKHRVLNDVGLRYYEVLGARQRMTIAAELLKVAEDGMKIAEQLRKAKQAARADVLLTEFDVTQIRIIQENAKIDYEAAWKRLAAVLGRPGMEDVKLTGSLKRPASKRDWESTYQQLLADSPQLQALRARAQGARAAVCRQEAQPIPNLLTQFGIAHDYGNGDVITNVQIGIPLPIRNKNQGNIHVAHAELQRAIRDAERLELQLRDRLATAFRSYKKAKFQVEQYEKHILRIVEESRKLTEGTYKAGQVNLVRVLTARRSYFEANLRYVDALIALRKAAVIIDGFVLTGGLTDVPDISSRPFGGLGLRGQGMSGQ